MGQGQSAGGSPTQRAADLSVQGVGREQLCPPFASCGAFDMRFD